MIKCKKLVAFIMALIMMLSIAVPSFALGKWKSDSKLQFGKSLENVATLYLFYTNANPKMPHMWVYFQSNVDETLNIGPYQIEPYGAVSIGSWRDRGDGAGIHFNLERYWVKEATYGRAWCISTQVSRNELVNVGNFLDMHNNWSWIFNCTWCAISIWNKCSVKQIPYVFAPTPTLYIMLMYGAKRPDFTISKCTNSGRVYKYITGGSLKIVNRGALYTNTGV